MPLTMQNSAKVVLMFHNKRNSMSRSSSALNKKCDVKQDLLSFKKMILGSYINILLLLFPIAIISHALDWSPTLVFFINFFAMLPLASMLGDATECLAEHLGETIGGLLNASFGNAVEIVIMVLALVKAKSADDDLRDELLIVVQTSLIGSIFSNSLLVVGCCFVANGIYYKESIFSLITAGSNVSLLLLAAFVMLLPGPYGEHIGSGNSDTLKVSRAAAIILMALYICLLVFVLYSHAGVIEEECAQTRKLSMLKLEEEKSQRIRQELLFSRVDSKLNNINEDNFGELNNARSRSDDELFGIVEPAHSHADEVDLSLIGSLILLLVSTVMIALLSEYLVDSISPMADNVGMSSAFVGIILLPIIGNGVEHITAVRMAANNKMDVALSIAIGSATQVAMFVVSLAVLVAWAMDLGLDLAFNQFEINLLIFSTIIVFTLISDGTSNWLEGAMLLGLYILIAIAVWPQDYSKDRN